MRAELDRRAAVFAALGEPLRLAIVDRLALADLSPGRLGAELGLGSNLLAHHLRVLEDAGVIRRTRSEGDHRRSYISLRRDDPTVRAATTTADDDRGTPAVLSRVVFVCTGNSARSQLAAAAWNSISSTPAASAGTHPARRVHPRAVRVAHRHGLRLDHAVPTSVDDVLARGDLVVAVCDNAHEELDPELPRLHWSIPDPVRHDTARAFEQAYADIDGRVHDLVSARAQLRMASPSDDGVRGREGPAAAAVAAGRRPESVQRGLGTGGHSRAAGPGPRRHRSNQGGPDPAKPPGQRSDPP